MIISESLLPFTHVYLILQAFVGLKWLTRISWKAKAPTLELLTKCHPERQRDQWELECGAIPLRAYWANLPPPPKAAASLLLLTLDLSLTLLYHLAVQRTNLSNLRCLRALSFLVWEGEWKLK